jgi:hypothetical protein
MDDILTIIIITNRRYHCIRRNSIWLTWIEDTGNSPLCKFFFFFSLAWFISRDISWRCFIGRVGVGRGGPMASDPLLPPYFEGSDLHHDGLSL